VPLHLGLLLLEGDRLRQQRRERLGHRLRARCEHRGRDLRRGLGVAQLGHHRPDGQPHDVAPGERPAPLVVRLEPRQAATKPGCHLLDHRVGVALVPQLQADARGHRLRHRFRLHLDLLALVEHVDLPLGLLTTNEPQATS